MATTPRTRTVDELVARSNRLGADPRNTNYAGGNTSAKGTETDPVTGEPVELLWVKGSGGDLGTLTRAGPGRAAAGPAARAGRRLPGRGARGRDGRRVRLLPARQGRGRAVDRHRDARPRRRARTSTTCTPTPASRSRPPPTGRSSPRTCFGDRVVWVPWRRPGFQLGLDIAAIKAAEPAGHRRASSAGTASPPGATPARRREAQLAGDHPHRARRSSTSTARPEPFGPVVAGLRAAAGGRAPGQGRRAVPDDPRDRLAPTGRRSATSPTATWCWTSSPARSSRRWPRWARPARTTSCAPRSSRWCSTCPPTASVEEIVARLRGAARGLPRRTTRPTTTATPRPDSPRDARRRPGDRAGARRRACSRFGKDKQTARVAGEFYVNAINVMRGAESVSTLRPDRARRRSSASSTGRWRRPSSPRMPKPKPLATRVALVTGAGVGHRQGHRRAARRRGRLRRRRRPGRWTKAAGRGRRARAAPTSPSACRSTSPTRTPSRAAARRGACWPSAGVDLVVNNAGLSISKPLLETTVADWDLQHDVMAKGSFLVSRDAAQAMIAQGLGGDIVYISSARTRCSPGPNNIAYARHQGRPGPPGAAARRRARRARHPGQRHQPRRRGARLRDLRRRLGRQAGRGLRGRGGGPGRLLRQAHPAQARGAARARRRRRRSPSPAATCPRPPACTSRSTPASPRRSCDERDRARRRGRPRGVQRPGDARPGRAGPPGARPRCTGSATAPVRLPRRAALGRARPLPRHPGRAAGRRAASPEPLAGVGDRLLGGRLRAARRERRAARQPASTTATRAPTPAIETVHAQVGPARALRRQRPAVPAVQHALPAGRRARTLQHGATGCC